MKHIDVSVDFCGVHFENPFILASAPPTANYDLIKRGFQAGWAAAVIKTITHNPYDYFSPRFNSFFKKKTLIAFENIEQISRRSIGEWVKDIKRLRKEFRNKVIIGSIMPYLENDEWLKYLFALLDAGASIIELNLSCPHFIDGAVGLTLGQSPEAINEIITKVKKVADVPILAKLTSNVTDIVIIGQAGKAAGVNGFTAINTHQGLIGIDIDTFRPLPVVNGLSCIGGISGPALKPIALKCIIQLKKYLNVNISGAGGITESRDIIEFILAGATTVQVATAVMLYSFDIVKHFQKKLKVYMKKHNFEKIEDFSGLSVQYLKNPNSIPLIKNIAFSIDATKCSACKKCIIACRDGAFNAIEFDEEYNVAFINEKKCDSCGLCYIVCPTKCIAMNYLS